MFFPGIVDCSILCIFTRHSARIYETGRIIHGISIRRPFSVLIGQGVHRMPYSQLRILEPRAIVIFFQSRAIAIRTGKPEINP